MFIRLYSCSSSVVCEFSILDLEVNKRGMSSSPVLTGQDRICF